MELPEGVVGLAGLGKRPDEDGIEEPVSMQVGSEEVLGVGGEGEEDRSGDGRADGALGGDGGGRNGGGFVLVAVSGDAEAGAFRRLFVAAGVLVGDPPQVVEYFLVSGDEGGGQGGLSVDGIETGQLGGLGGVPAGMGGGCGVRCRRRAGGGRRGRGWVGRRGRRRGRTAGYEGLGAGLVGRNYAAVVADVHGRSVERVYSAAETPLEVPVEPEGLAYLDEWDGAAWVGEGAAQAVGGGAGFHGGAGGLHGAVASGDGGVMVVVVADKEAGGLPGDGSGGRETVGARGVVAGFLSHSEGKVPGEVGRLGGDADVGVADRAMLSFATANAPRGLGGNGAPVDAHGVEGVNEDVFFGLCAAVS